MKFGRSLMLGLLAAFYIAGSPNPTRACSLSPDFVPAHNYDLVAYADAIVVAEAVANASAREWGGVRFRSIEALKGRPPAWFVVGGALGHPPYSDPNGLMEPNRESSYGACQRVTFRRGDLYVMFLRREDGEWFEVDYPYARVNEDYYGPESVWVRAIRAYVTVQAQHDGEDEVRALQQLEDEYQRRADDQADFYYNETWAILAEDIRIRRDPYFAEGPFLPPSRERPTAQQIAAGASLDYPGVTDAMVGEERTRSSAVAALAGLMVLMGSIGWALWVSMRANRPS